MLTPQPKIDKHNQIVCPKCGEDNFEVKHKLHFLSALQSPQGIDTIVNVERWFCADCSHMITKEDLDDQFKKPKN